MDNVIYSYTRQNAIEDGIFVDVTATAHESKLAFPVVIVTTNLFHTHIKPSDEMEDEEVNIRLAKLINTVRGAVEKTLQEDPNEGMITLEHTFDKEAIKVWAFIEDNGLNIILPEDY